MDTNTPQRILIGPDLRDYQIEGYKHLVNTRRAILADDMGLGKTAQALAAVELMEKKRILIICPNTVKAVWSMEIDKWLGKDVTRALIGGNITKRQNQLGCSARFYIMNYELLRLHKSALVTGRWDAIIFDEAHRLKNRKAQVTQSAFVICTANKNAALFLLTGTPILNRAEELWSLLHMIDPRTYRGYWKWVFANMEVDRLFYGNTRFPVHDVKGPKDPAGLKEDLRHLLLRRMKKDVIDLPDKTFITIPVNLVGAQRKAYNTMYNNMYAKINEKEIGASIVLAQITRLKQICVSHLLLDEESEEVEGAKIDALLEIVDGLGDQQCVVFSQFAQAITRLYNWVPGLMFTGKTKHREDIVDKFQKGKEKVLMCTMQSGGIGITLTAASVVIFLDLLWTPALNMQAVDRVHRIGQDKPVTVYTLQAENTIESAIVKMLEGKATLFEGVIPVKEVARRLFI